ncbi:hypothetical protein BN946_scf185015.g93 [Trametes cinnabarina]|uniref:INO80 complex subunit F domain-containing protein n=1 Tax=Pycnoporus cinnabarinus TaxID=5643 RepID=A0A060SHA0_PYCCI|nr:hypothetical protein BN946_scf185015.g93 [Trametes cinnabarina]
MLPRPPSPNPPYAPPHGGNYNASLTNAYDRKQKQRSIMGITAGAEDTKYQAKYKELKKKVKEIEADNDRLYFKLLLAKKNIRRMNLERAILYERLAAVPPTPGRHTQELPAEQDPIFHPQPPAPPENARAIDPNDREVVEYMHAHPNARIVTGPDGRVVAIEDTPTVDARGAPVPSGPPPPHGIPLVHGFRHDSGPGYDPARQLPPPPHMIPLIQHAPELHPEPVLSNDPQAHEYSYSQSRPPPPLKSHSHSSSSHHSRSSSARPDLEPIAGLSHVDAHAGPFRGHSHSPVVPGEPQNEHRGPRHSVQESHVHQLPHQHIHVPQQHRPSSPPLVSPTAHGRDGRIHNHQRIGPGAHIHRERDTERDRELQQQLQYERELEREREEQRAIELRHRLAMEEQEEEALWAQEEARVRARALSRSGSPGPHPGESRGTSRPASGQAHDHDRVQRPYAPHVSNLLGIERDPGLNDDQRDVGSSSRDRTLAAETPQPSGAESRKRSREEMEVDDRYEGEGRAANEAGTSSRGSVMSNGNRTSKRTHPDEVADAGHPAYGNEEDIPEDRMEEDA